MSIATWMPTLTANMRAISGIQQAHDYSNLPGAISVFPTAIIMPVSGTQSGGSSAPGIALHQVQITVYTSNVILPEANGAAVPFIKKVRDKIYSDVKLNGNAALCLPASEGSFYEGPGAIAYGDKTLTGIVFHVTVKEVETLTVA